MQTPAGQQGEEKMMKAVQNIPKMGVSLSGKRQAVQILCNLEAA